jgi:glycosyltransferase involved in cell wall biosynthesis
MKKLKVLINTPDISKIGGVANFYLSLNGKFENEVKYNYIGGSSKKSNFILSLITDYIRYIVVLIKFRPDIVHLNPSLDKKSVLRDAVYVIITKLFFRKLLVFWHGWQDKTESVITKKYAFVFRIIYNRADSHCVLASDFKNALIKWGITKPVYLETTIFNEDILKGFNIENKKITNSSMLFLSRIEEQKGIFIALETFETVVKEFPESKMLVAGTGEDLDRAKKYVEVNKIKNVEFLGFVTGEKKHEIIQNSLINFFPTFYGEGMPISILESMACGSIIITRPVGGIKDFFENDKMGYITESKDPNDFAVILKKLLKDMNKLKEISGYNYRYANERFKASAVAKRIENIYSEIVNKKK